MSGGLCVPHWGMELNSMQFSLIKVLVYRGLRCLVKGNFSGVASKPATVVDKTCP